MFKTGPKQHNLNEHVQLNVVNYSFVVAVDDRRRAHPADMFVLTDPMMEITIAKKYEKYFAKSFAPIMLLYWLPRLTVHDEEKMNDLYYSERLVTHSGILNECRSTTATT